jgi:hypothetical protein
MRFKPKDEKGVYRSVDGRYAVWVQARPRDDGPHWAASRAETLYGTAGRSAKWLTEHAASKRDAIEVCIADSLKRSTSE